MARKFLCVSLLLILAVSSTSEATMLKKGKLPDQYPDESKQQQHHKILPKRGDIAVIVQGDNKMHVSAAEAMIIQELVKHGYRVVDEKKMKAARAAAVRAQAYRLAMQGNYNAIFKLNAHYSCAATILAKVQAGKPVNNELGVFTCTSSISLFAVTSSGVKLGGDTAQGKALGYTEDEAQQNAVNDAVRNALSQIF